MPDLSSRARIFSASGVLSMLAALTKSPVDVDPLSPPVVAMLSSLLLPRQYLTVPPPSAPASVYPRVPAIGQARNGMGGCLIIPARYAPMSRRGPKQAGSARDERQALTHDVGGWGLGVGVVGAGVLDRLHAENVARLGSRAS